jgi:glutaredoxin-related protein
VLLQYPLKLGVNTYMLSQQISGFQNALKTIEALSIDDQLALVDVLHNRLNLRQRHQIVQEVQEFRQEFMEGKFRSGSVDDFLAELDR